VCSSDLCAQMRSETLQQFAFPEGAAWRTASVSR